MFGTSDFFRSLSTLVPRFQVSATRVTIGTKRDRAYDYPAMIKRQATTLSNEAGNFSDSEILVKCWRERTARRRSSECSWHHCRVDEYLDGGALSTLCLLVFALRSCL
jgi:hypothetical protein